MLQEERISTVACSKIGVESLKGKTIEWALLKGLVLSNFSPGVDFINDKMFGLHVDSLIRFYLKESPILESIPARSLAFPRPGCQKFVEFMFGPASASPECEQRAIARSSILLSPDRKDYVQDQDQDFEKEYGKGQILL